MKRYCDFHPISPAKWHCGACHSHFDSACVPDGDERRQFAKCPLCQKSMKYLREETVNFSFWEESARFFRIPFKPEILLVWLFLSLIAVAIPNNLLIALVILLAMTMVGAYVGVGMLNTIASKPYAALTLKDIFDNQYLTVALIAGAILFALGVINYYAFVLFGLGTGLPLMVLSIYLSPAWVMAFCIHKDLNESIQPSVLLAPILQMGAAYFGFLIYILVAIFVVLVVADFASKHFHDLLVWPTTIMMAIYVTFSLFAMMGHIVAEYYQFEKKKQRTDTSSAPFVGDDTLRLDAKLDIALKQGLYADALDILEAAIKRDPKSDYRRTQFLKLLLATKDMARLEHHVHGILKMLADRNQLDLAEEVICRLQEANPKFLLYDLPLCLDLAERFHKTKNDEMVLWLADGAHSRFELDEKIALLYLLAAKSLVSKHKQAGKARQFLRFILQNFADHESAKAARILHEHVAKYST